MVDLIGSHLEFHRRNQACIAVHVMGTLSSEERDKKLKHYSTAVKELHTALIFPEDEYKALKRLMGEVLTVVSETDQEHQFPNDGMSCHWSIL